MDLVLRARTHRCNFRATYKIIFSVRQSVFFLPFSIHFCVLEPVFFILNTIMDLTDAEMMQVPYF